MERIDEAVASVETMDIMTSILLEVILKLELFFPSSMFIKMFISFPISKLVRFNR